MQGKSYSVLMMGSANVCVGSCFSTRQNCEGSIDSHDKQQVACRSRSTPPLTACIHAYVGNQSLLQLHSRYHSANVDLYPLELCVSIAGTEPLVYSSFGAGCSEVEVNMLTGERRVLRADVMMDAGNSLSPAIDMGQVCRIASCYLL